MLDIKLVKKAVLLIACTTAVVTGCGKKNEASSGSVAKETSASKTSSSEVSAEVPPMSTDGLMYGIILSASEKTFTVQSDLGTSVSLAIEKEIDTSGAKEGIATGMAVKIEYEGNINKKAKVKKITDSDKLPKLDKAALEAAGGIILAIKNKDKRALAKLCEYPLIFDKGKERRIGSLEDFDSLKSSAIFTNRLVNSVSKTNLFVTNAYNDGFLLGLSRPNIVVQNTKDGYFITGFHYK